MKIYLPIEHTLKKALKILGDDGSPSGYACATVHHAEIRAAVQAAVNDYVGSQYEATVTTSLSELIIRLSFKK